MKVHRLLYLSSILVIANLFGPHSFADILILDLNFSSQEVAIIRAEAAKKVPAEKVIVLPEIPDSERDRLGRLRINEGNSENLKELQAAGAKYHFDQTLIDKVISENNIRSIHISGHSDGPSFSGYTTENFNVDYIDKVYERIENSPDEKLESTSDALALIKSQLKDSYIKRSEALTILGRHKELLQEEQLELDAVKKELLLAESKLIPSKKKVEQLRLLLGEMEQKVAERNGFIVSFKRDLSVREAEIDRQTVLFKEAKHAYDLAYKEKEELKTQPSKRSTLESIYLWGCYGNTPQQTLWWHDNFPSVKLVAGFDGTAPLGTTKVARELLSDLMRAEPDLMAVCAQGEMKHLLNSMVMPGLGQTHSAIAIMNTSYCGIVSHDLGARSFDQFHEECVQLKTEIDSRYEDYARYWYGTPESFANPPVSTKSGSVLREFYNSVQRGHYCVGAYEGLDMSYVPNPDSLRLLLFFNNFKINFAKFNDDKISRVNKILSRIGVSDSLLFPNYDEIKKLSRAQIIKRVFDFSKLDVALLNEEEKKIYDDLAGDATIQLVDLSCITDIMWVEPTDSQARGLREPDC